MERLSVRVAQICNLNIREGEARVQGHSLPLSKFEANLDHTIPFLKNKCPQMRETGFWVHILDVKV